MFEQRGQTLSNATPHPQNRAACAVLNQCNYVVLDEADRMIDLGFEPQASSHGACARVLLGRARPAVDARRR